MSRPPDPAIPGPAATGSALSTSDRLISIGDIRELFKLGRTAAYELTHRPEFPEPVPISSRCYRWWASEVDAFAESLRCKHPDQSAGGGTQRATKAQTPHPATPPRRITGKVRAARARKGNIVTAPTVPGQAPNRAVTELGRDETTRTLDIEGANDQAKL